MIVLTQGNNLTEIQMMFLNKYCNLKPVWWLIWNNDEVYDSLQWNEIMGAHSLHYIQVTMKTQHEWIVKVWYKLPNIIVTPQALKKLSRLRRQSNVNILQKQKNIIDNRGAKMDNWGSLVRHNDRSINVGISNGTPRESHLSATFQVFSYQQYTRLSINWGFNLSKWVRCIEDIIKGKQGHKKKVKIVGDPFYGPNKFSPHSIMFENQSYVANVFKPKSVVKKKLNYTTKCKVKEAVAMKAILTLYLQKKRW
jgi:hypothetical protein